MINLETITLTIWILGIMSYIAFTSSICLYVFGYANTYGRHWKEVYPSKLKWLIIRIQTFGALMVLFSAMLLL